MTKPKILWDFQIQTDKLVMAVHPDIVVVDKKRKTAIVIDVAMQHLSVVCGLFEINISFVVVGHLNSVQY